MQVLEEIVLPAFGTGLQRAHVMHERRKRQGIPRHGIEAVFPVRQDGQDQLAVEVRLRNPQEGVRRLLGMGLDPVAGPEEGAQEGRVGLGVLGPPGFGRVDDQRGRGAAEDLEGIRGRLRETDSRPGFATGVATNGLGICGCRSLQGPEACVAWHDVAQPWAQRSSTAAQASNHPQCMSQSVPPQCTAAVVLSNNVPRNPSGGRRNGRHGQSRQEEDTRSRRCRPRRDPQPASREDAPPTGCPESG